MASGRASGVRGQPAVIPPHERLDRARRGGSAQTYIVSGYNHRRVAPQPEVGSTASSYEILAKLATGGMAEIFLARGASAAGVERYVVLKRALRERATDAAFVRMFLDEARLAAQLQHPNIAQVYDIGKLGDSYFFTMEYVHGETVRALLQRSHGLRRPIPIGSVLTVAAGAAAGLHHAHERIGIDGKPLGIVHRDVSPSNLMVSYEGNVKLVDFGVAKAAHNTVETRSGTVKGKIAYLSPEQCRGRHIDRRSDLFSLGIVLWEMLTTERLFRHPSDFETMAAIANTPSDPPSSRRPDVPPELDALVLKLLAKEPDDRYQTADELLEHIEQIAVRTGTALSTAALGRVVRELFGQRPEPWIELRSGEEHQHVVTVTSEPLPSELSLSAVPELRPTPPLRHPDVLAGVPTAPLPAADASLPVPAAPVPTLIAPGAPPPARPGSSSIPPFSPSHASGSNPFGTTDSNPFSQTGGAVVQPSPFGTTGSVSAAGQPARKLPRLVWILVPAVIVGVVLGLVVGLGGSKKHAPVVRQEGSAVAMVSSDAAPLAVIDPPAPGDAAAAMVPADAAVMAPADARAPVGPRQVVSADAAPAEHVEHHAAPKELAAMKPTEAVAACATPGVLAANAVTCTLAACKAKDLGKARKWLASVPASKRAAVTSACPALAPPADDACKKNPLACQH
jgi:serine/threonine protein kinase